jgi:hypothetical protein
MRLIDGDELQKIFNETSTSLMREPKLLKDMEHMVRAFLMTTEMIKDAPTIEAEPVKHGRWIFKSRSKLINTGKLFVSSRVYTPKSLPTSEFCEIPRGSYFFKKSE